MSHFTWTLILDQGALSSTDVPDNNYTKKWNSNEFCLNIFSTGFKLFSEISFLLLFTNVNAEKTQG